MKSLLLDQNSWDLLPDASGNIACASNPYSIAQDVASAAKTFSGECWYNTTLGLPYFGAILGKIPPPIYVKQQIIDAGMTIEEVKDINVNFTNFDERNLSGQILVTDINNNVVEVGF